MIVQSLNPPSLNNTNSLCRTRSKTLIPTYSSLQPRSSSKNRPPISSTPPISPINPIPMKKTLMEWIILYVIIAINTITCRINFLLLYTHLLVPHKALRTFHNLLHLSLSLLPHQRASQVQAKILLIFQVLLESPIESHLTTLRLFDLQLSYTSRH